ncbi:hypothetical protein MGYG_07688 [Nannizzia gypsea CBS 118893]|uniref:Uncharacterized protein n=1 Tax=Arthroderma gypseum (strain ATCC MYA-4604 / CBS 118893) TaxID=535722 RepID=E4V3V8_ARTGP|nr:hypothetical protein MGYG_07688 [Nannizzia gypsea CBS 118893]EFR04682.1 hypothetical protein MGYG_07688 [Nannizzia gypsea CBS 118893]
MLSPQQRGVSRVHTLITIVILVREDSTSDWTVVREKVVEVLDSMGLHRVAVEIRRGSLLQFHNRLPVEGFLTQNGRSLEPRMGGTIGPHSSTFSSSTFGGSLEVQRPSEGWKRYGLTNHHCVTALKSTADWDKHGIMPNDPSVLRNEKHVYEYARTEISHWRGTLDHAREYYLRDQLLLGKVYASSGYRMGTNKRILDWASLEVESKRVSENKLPSIDDIPRGSPALYLTAKEVLDGPAAPHEEMGVCKIGRNTGFSEGMLGAITETDIQCWFRDANGNWVKSRGLAFLVHRKAPRLTFGKPEDSGSFIFSLEGSFIGLYMGVT